MRIIVLILATATTVLSAGLALVLYILPSTSLLPNVARSGRPTMVAAGVALLAVLLIGCAAGVSIISTTLRPVSANRYRLASRFVTLAAVVALIDAAAAQASPMYRRLNIWWLDALLILTALTYLAHRGTQQPQ
jgi:hypothetical protein